MNTGTYHQDVGSCGDSDVVMYREMSGVLGIVEEIPNSLFAVVNVEYGNIGKLMCYRSCLKTEGCKIESIEEVIQVGDKLTLRLRHRSAYCDSKEWFVLEASKISEEPELKRKIKKDITRNDEGAVESEKETALKSKTVDSSDSSKPSFAGGAPFKKSWPKENRRYLLNWPGVVKIQQNSGDFSLRIEHSFGETIVDVDSPIISALNNDVTMDFEQLSKIVNREIRFDGEFNASQLLVKKIWWDERCPSNWLLTSQLLSVPCFTRFDICYWGNIISIPCHNIAIASIGGIPVLVPLNSLSSQDLVGSSSTMDMFFKTGAKVFMKIKRNEGYFEAEKCWRRVKSEYIFRGEEHDPSWVSTWGSEDVLKEGILGQENGQMFIRDSSNLEIERCKLYINGCLAKPSQLNSLVGSKISYIKCGKLITCAWSGDAPSPLVLLKDRLAVPKGLVDESKYYDAVIDDFPLPTHAICKIGLVPVLLNLCHLGENVEKSSLKRGDVVSVCVEETMIYDVTCLVSKSTEKCISESLLVNFTGRLVDEPEPVGVIKADNRNFIVHFELCCVKATKKKFCTDVFLWFEYVKGMLTKDAKVCFTAKSTVAGSYWTDEANAIPYCAVEVCVDDEIA